MSKTSSILTTAVVALGLGAVGGYFLGQSAPPETNTSLEGEASLDEVRTERDALALGSSELREDVTKLREENAGLRRELERVRAESAQAIADAVRVEEPTLEEKLAIAFGDLERLAALDGTPWADLATAAARIDDAVAALAAAREAGEQVDPAVQKAIQAENTKLRAYALGLIGKLPTNVTGNGEFTHPLSSANLLAAYLDEAELPLTAAQRETLAALGSDYDAAFAETNAAYDESTYNLQKLLDELDLKQEFHHAAFESLDEQQYETMMAPDIRGKVRMDVMSPGVMLSRTSQSLVTGSTTELRSELVNRVSKWFERPADEIAHHPAFDSWIRDMDALLDPVTRTQSSVYTVDEAEIAGRAQLAAFHAFESSLELTEQQLRRLRGSQYLFVPRIVPGNDDG